MVPPCRKLLHQLLLALPVVQLQELVISNFIEFSNLRFQLNLYTINFTIELSAEFILVLSKIHFSHVLLVQ